MKFEYPIVSVASLLMLASISTAHADSNGIVFPPADNSRIFQYPPQQPVAPMRPGAPYVFGQPSTATMPAPRMAPQRYMARPPMQRNAPYAMPNRGRYPTSNGTFNNRRQNTPFRNGNNSRGNNFSPFSGGSNPMNNMFGNNGNNSMPFFGGSNNSMPFLGNSSNNSIPFFGNNNSNSMPFFGNNNNNNTMPFFGNTRDKNRKKAWGKKRNIWPDFYTDFTDDAWDSVSSGPRDLGQMPGGWRFPHISTPDPVTVTDAITNQFPPIMEEGGNMMDFSDWGVFDNK